MPLSFSKKFKADITKHMDKVNDAIVETSLGAWKVAVDATPAPPTPSLQRYKRTGRLRAGWKLSTKRSGLIPAFGNYKYPKTPNLKFDMRRDKMIRLFNNIPYAVNVEEGSGKGHRTPRKMMFKARIYFEAHIKLNMPK